MDFLGYLLVYSPFVIVGAFLGLILFMIYKSHQETESTHKQTNKIDKTNQDEDNLCGSGIIESFHDVEIRYNGLINTDNQRI